MKDLIRIAAAILPLIVAPSNGAAAAPDIKVQAEPSSVEKGRPVRIRYHVNPAGKALSVGFFLTSDEKRNPWKAVGPSGPLSLKSQSVPASGQGDFTWDGKSFGCAPTDAPRLCPTPPEPGVYVLEAVLFATSDVELVRTLRVEAAQPVLGRTTAALTVTGEFDLKPIKTELFGQAVHMLREKFKLPSFSTFGAEKFVIQDGDVKPGRKLGEYCQDFSFGPPFAGSTRICTSRAKTVQGFTVLGEPLLVTGKLGYSAAVDKAVAAVSDRSMSVSIRDWAYRAQEKSWVLALDASKAGGQGPSAAPIQEVIHVRITDDGQVCLLPSDHGRKGRAFNLSSDPFPCPKSRP